MKFTSFLFLFVVILGVTSCTEENKPSPYESSVSGYFDNIPGTMLTLAKQTPEGIIPVDSAWVNEDGSFLFTYPFDEITVYRVFIDFSSYLTIAAKKGDHITLEADGADLYNDYYVEGSSESELIKIVVDETMELSRKLDSIKVDINHQKSAKNSKGLYDSFESQKVLYINYHDFSIDFITKHPGSIAAYFVVIALQPEEDPEQFKIVAKNLSQSYPNFNFLPKLEETVGTLSTIEIGTAAPELNFPSPNGAEIALSSLKGKYVLLDFWASWCRPCRAQNPNILRIYNQFKDQGFEIYGYSLDENEESWKNAIIEDSINWIHTSDVLGWEAAGGKTYGIQSLPTTYLIDPEGVVIAKNLNSNALEEKLTAIFATQQ